MTPCLPFVERSQVDIGHGRESVMYAMRELSHTTRVKQRHVVETRLPVVARPYSIHGSSIALYGRRVKCSEDETSPFLHR